MIAYDIDIKLRAGLFERKALERDAEIQVFHFGGWLGATEIAARIALKMMFDFVFPHNFDSNLDLF